MANTEDKLEKMAREFLAKDGFSPGDLNGRMFAFAHQIVQKCAETVCLKCRKRPPDCGSLYGTWTHDGIPCRLACDASPIWEAFGTDGTGGKGFRKQPAEHKEGSR